MQPGVYNQLQARCRHFGLIAQPMWPHIGASLGEGLYTQTLLKIGRSDIVRPGFADSYLTARGGKSDT